MGGGDKLRVTKCEKCINNVYRIGKIVTSKADCISPYYDI